MEKLIDVMAIGQVQSSLYKGVITVEDCKVLTILLSKYVEDKEMYETITDLLDQINKFLTRSE